MLAPDGADHGRLGAVRPLHAAGRDGPARSSRSYPDGSDLRVYAGGIRAPFGLAFYPGTSDLLATFNQRDDLGADTPGDWLALVRAGEQLGLPGLLRPGAARRAPACRRRSPSSAACRGRRRRRRLTSELGGRFGRLRARDRVEARHRAARRAPEGAAATYSGDRHAVPHRDREPLPVIVTAGGAVLVGDWRSGTIYRIAAG